MPAAFAMARQQNLHKMQISTYDKTIAPKPKTAISISVATATQRLTKSILKKTRRKLFLTLLTLQEKSRYLTENKI